jgi:hypothetical protein
MKKKWFRTSVLVLTFSLLVSVALAATTVTEQEPNDTPAQANKLTKYSPMEGAVEPAGDEDYFWVKGINNQWGMVALLDADASTASQQGVLTAYAPDGVTLLQQDEGMPGKKAMVAWANFTSRDTHYLRVNESGNDQPLSQYSLQYYELAIGEEPEQEPNDTPATANTSSKVNNGVIDRVNDVDCYALYAQPEQKFIFALNADPEGDGGPADFILDLYKNDGTLWVSADRAGPGGNEYIDEVVIPEEGVYAYCVRAQTGAAPSATYLSGPIRDGSNYQPSHRFDLSWENPRPGDFARVGDEMRYTLHFTHTSPLTVPGPLRLRIEYRPECQSFVDANSPDYQGSSYFGWEYDEASPNMVVTKTFVLRATTPCAKWLSYDVIMEYYDTGWGKRSCYIIGEGYYQPLIMK